MQVPMYVGTADLQQEEGREKNETILDCKRLVVIYKAKAEVGGYL